MTRRLFAVALLLGLAGLIFAADKPVTDDILIDQVRVKLADDQDVGGMKIDVEVHQGKVTLKGKVRTEKQKAKAEKVAKKVKGVTGVANQLVVSPD